MSDRPLAFDDIQGDILGGFNTDVQILLGFGATEDAARAAAIAWLARLAPDITSVADVRRTRTAMKAHDTCSDAAPVWLAVALSKALLGFAAPDVLILDQAFHDGMIDGAASSLGDRSNPDDWVAGAPSRPIDILLKVAGNDPRSVTARAEAIFHDARSRGLTLTYCERGDRLPGEIEHFGFRDHISQPEVLGDGTAGGHAPGRFLFGYPRDPGGQPPALTVDPHSVTDNGSLLVFRRLVQDVRAFRSFVAERAASLQASWPGLTADHLAALIVGRWPSGAPLQAGRHADPRPADPDNSFDFFGDDDGMVCPFGAHIRKVNPRKGSSDVVEVPRMLRRGTPFGPLFEENPTAERGLLFLAYQASITATFLFVSSRWMNSGKSPGRGDDLLVGRPFDDRAMVIQGPDGPVELRTGGLQWIRPTGGVYLFAPGIAGLKKLCAIAGSKSPGGAAP
ncbi:Dyp-type peroxidase [Rhizorhabdus sp. FW153]|uniref:Dyp-type peroxidase n=1 Tax=Rhizorhabdus sp. FW153 TaxID=3400216 RepID=UPI003CE8DE80